MIVAATILRPAGTMSCHDLRRASTVASGNGRGELILCVEAVACACTGIPCHAISSSSEHHHTLCAASNVKAAFRMQPR